MSSNEMMRGTAAQLCTTNSRLKNLTTQDGTTRFCKGVNVRTTDGSEQTEPSRERHDSYGDDWEDGRPNSKFPVANDTELILRQVRAVLNKLSPVNFDRLLQRFVNLIPQDSIQLVKIMQFMVTKAMDDPMYMQIYAHLMGGTIKQASSTHSRSISKTLIGQIHHELQRLATDMEIAKFNRFVDGEDAARRKKVILHRFIAELFVEGVCTTRFIMERVMDLIVHGKRNLAEAAEPLECLCVLFTFAGAKLEEVKHEWLDEIFLKMNLKEAVKSPVISKRIQFMLLDLMEMRSNGWATQNKWWPPSVSLSSD